MRRYPRINGPAALPLFCLAPHGVFRASRIAPRAVSSYLAFSPLPDLRCQRTGGVFSVTLSVTALLQARRPRVLRGMLPYGVRTFLWRRISPRQRSSAIGADVTTFFGARKVSSTKGTTVTMVSIEQIFVPFVDSVRGLPQIGAGAATKNQLTITRAIVSLPSMPARLPSNVPQPARPALTRRFPATSSPAIAPTTGPTINPGKG
jgi:hypothetical protein